METRSQTETLTFRHAFTLPGLPEPQPAGAYTVETEEEMIEGLSFAAWRRVSTILTRRHPDARGVVQALAVDPRDLARAHAADTAG